MASKFTLGKRILSLILAFSLILSFVPTTARAVDTTGAITQGAEEPPHTTAPSSGEPTGNQSATSSEPACASHVFEDGTLTISGTGDMASCPNWSIDTELIRSVVSLP